MKKQDILRFFNELSSRLFFDNNGETVETPKTRLADEIREAHQEWVRAQKYFQWVSDLNWWTMPFHRGSSGENTFIF